MIKELLFALQAYFMQIDGTLNKLTTVCKTINIFPSNASSIKMCT